MLVKRVYAMRGALLLLDYEEEATGPFRALLLQVYIYTHRYVCVYIHKCLYVESQNTEPANTH